MTKLEELKAAYDAADNNNAAANGVYAASRVANDAYRAWCVANDAAGAYYKELERQRDKT